MVAITGVVPALIAEKTAMSPFPVAERPMLGVLLVHEYDAVPPETAVVKVMAAAWLPLQITWLAGWSTSAVGLTVIVNVFVGPSQVTVPFKK